LRGRPHPEDGFMAGMQSRTRWKVVLFSLLALSTVLFIARYEPYQNVGPELLAAPALSGPWAQWQGQGPAGSIAIAGGEARLRLEDGAASARLTRAIDDPARFALLRFAGALRTEDVVGGEKEWEKARLVLSSLDAAGRSLPVDHHLVRLTGSRPWKEYAKVFRVSRETRKMVATVQLLHSTGTVWVKDLSLRPVAEKPVFAACRAVAFFLWGAFLLWLLAPYAAGARNLLLRGAVVLAVAAILAGTLMPADMKFSFLDDLSVTTQQVQVHKESAPRPPAAPSDAPELWQSLFKTRHVTSKLGHFAFFGVLAVALRLARPGQGKTSLFTDALMLAGATEMLQFFVEGRSPAVFDLLIDASGVLFGAAALWLVRRGRRRPAVPVSGVI